MKEITAYVKFNGNCKEALNRYQEIFGGEVNIMKVSETPMAANFAPAVQDKVMHATLMLNGKTIFMGSDMIRDEYDRGNAHLICIDCSSEEELRDLFAKLSEGGQVDMAPEPMFWGGLFASLTDKFGVEWMFNFSK